MAFVDKRVLITGGAGCLGLETAKRFSAEKATVIIVDKNDTNLTAAKKLLPDATTISVDLIDWGKTRSALQGIGRVDHLINNAGFSILQPFLEVQPEAIDMIFGVNFKAAVNVSQIVAAEMLGSTLGGTIVNVASIAGNRPLQHFGVSIYGSSKAALLQLTKCMATELGPTIRVNAVCPTVIMNPFMQNYVSKFPEKYEALLSRAPISRFLEPSEVVETIVFLSSSASSMITGTSLDIDGGYSVA